MPKEKLGATRGFRPRSKTAERLDYAEKFGINVSELINEVLELSLPKVLAKKIEAKKETLREVLDAPMP